MTRSRRAEAGSRAVLAALIAVFTVATLGRASDRQTEGRWAQRVQLVWDEASKQLVRRTLRVWDQVPELNLEFYWEPEGVAPARTDEAVTGRGTLTWRQRGRPNYDLKSVQSVYRGDMRKGRPNGQGRLETETGATYEGTWVDGRMHGTGHVRFDNGDEYTGEFRQGQIHGVGRHVAGTGEIYEGEFKQGRRHGTATIAGRDGSSRVSVWSHGVEIASNGTALPAQWTPGATGDIAIAVTTDSRKHAQFKRAAEEFGERLLTYTHQLGAGEVAILPDDKRFMGTWKQGAPMYSLGEIPNFAHVIYNTPAFVKVSLSAGRVTGQSVKALLIEIARSETDLQPFLGISGSFGPLFADDDGGEDLPFNPMFAIVNTGWGAPTGSRLSWSFTAQDPGAGSREFEQPVGTFDKVKRLSVERELLILGADVEQLKSWGFRCASVDQMRRCQEQTLAQLRLGQLRPHAYFFKNSRFLVTDLQGALTYQWTDQGGTVRTSRSPFRTSILLGAIQVHIPQERGAAGPDLPNAGVPIVELSTDRANYVLKVPLRSPVTLSDRGRDFVIGLFARKSSNHMFRVVAELSDGRRIRSQPVRMTYARPRPPPDWTELRPEPNR